MKYFISHSSKNFHYGESIVQLLIDIGVPHDDIIFTSKSGFGIPKGENIFEWLKSKIEDKPFVIYLLSDEYYSSVACLNEMGAAWIVENKHIALFTPKFNLKNPKFQEGAIDPRKIGVFIDNKDDMLEFATLISKNENKYIKPIIINHAINSFFNSINIYSHNESKVINHHSVENDINGSNVKEKESQLHPLVEVKENSNSMYIKFSDSIMQQKLGDEELLLINYMVDLGKPTLGDRWMAEEEVQNIRNWEEVNGLNNHLSKNYDTALNKLKLRKFLNIYSETSHGNPREFILIETISNHLLELPDAIHLVLAKTKEKHQKRNTNTMDLPF